MVVATGAAGLPLLRAGSKIEIEALDLRSREYFGISYEDQAEASDDRAFYNVCRRKIEDRGIFVLHETFPESDGSGFCLADPKHPIIVVNTKRSEEHTSELQSLMRISYAVFCLKKKKHNKIKLTDNSQTTPNT